MLNCLLIGDFANHFQESVIFPCVRHFTWSVRATRLFSYQLTRIVGLVRQLMSDSISGFPPLLFASSVVILKF